ncbi:tetratricopeptide repeat protein [Uliginosibacterium sp. sgz301328]|uniref:tetratricopeptide repeat protein n=1 Tax=Uliginosibacterium sp. sgz301328 TaxID=3243764 RepID=UPI00359EE427
MPNIARLTKSIIAAATCAIATSATLAADPPKAKELAASTTSGPAKELTGQYVYELMLAEIAAARGEYQLASAAYVDLARRTQDARIARRATEISLMGQQLQQAGEAARLWVQAEPDSVPALQTLAVVLANGAGSVTELEAPVARLLASGSAPLDSMLMQLPRLYGRYPDKAAVAASIERLTQPYINMPEAHFARAVAYGGAQDNTRAQAEAAEALRLRPDWEAAALLRAQSAPKEQQAEAMAQLNEFAKRNPTARESRVLYARWLVSEKRFDEARAAYADLKKSFPDDDDIAYVVVALAVQSDDYDTAERELQRLIDRKYRDPDLLRLQLGQVYEEAGNPARAVEQYRQVGEGQHYAPAQARMAMVMAKSGDVAGARALLEKAAAAGDEEESAAYQMAESQMLRDMGQTAEAQKVMESLLAKQPDNPEALYESAMLDDRLKNYEGMEKKLRRLIELKPDYAHAYNALGYSFVDRNVRLTEADQLLTKAIGLAPEDAAIMDSVGWLRYRKGDLPGALDMLQRAYAKLQDAEVAAHLGEVQWKMGHKDDARATWEGALKTAPDSPALRETIKRLTQ